MSQDIQEIAGKEVIFKYKKWIGKYSTKNLRQRSQTNKNCWKRKQPTKNFWNVNKSPFWKHDQG